MEHPSKNLVVHGARTERTVRTRIGVKPLAGGRGVVRNLNGLTDRVEPAGQLPGQDGIMTPPGRSIRLPWFPAGAPVPRFPAGPRLTVLVPHGGSDAAFEDSLASVLQHRGDDTEVIVVHDGHYADPFDLAGEVRFVDAGSRRLVSQIALAADAAAGQFIAILADGHRATANWSEAACEAFDDADVGCVAPLVRDAKSHRVHRGWRSSIRSACEPIGQRHNETLPDQTGGVGGAFLNAAVYRRNLLRRLCRTYRGDDVTEAALTFGHSMAAARWQTRTVQSCVLIAGPNHWTATTAAVAGNHRRLQAIADHFGGTASVSTRLARFLVTAAAGSLGEAYARATAGWAAEAVASSIDALASETVEAVAMPTPPSITRMAA